MRQVTPGQGISLTAIAKAARAAKDTRAGVSSICRVEDIVLGTQEGVMAWQNGWWTASKLPALLWLP